MLNYATHPTKPSCTALMYGLDVQWIGSRPTFTLQCRPTKWAYLQGNKTKRDRQLYRYVSAIMYRYGIGYKVCVGQLNAYILYYYISAARL
jgi:hypothetical protein